MEDDYGSNVYAKLEKNCLLYGVSALECSLWRDFGIRDSLRIRMGGILFVLLREVSTLEDVRFREVPLD